MAPRKPWIMTVGTILFGGLALTYWPSTYFLSLAWLVILMGYVLIARSQTQSMFVRKKGPGIDLVFRLSYLFVLLSLIAAHTIYFIYEMPSWLVQGLGPMLKYGAPAIFLSSILFSFFAHSKGRSVQREKVTAPRGMATFTAWIVFFLLPLWMGSVSSASGLRSVADTSGRALTPADRIIFSEIRSFARSRKIIGGVAAIVTPEGTAYLKYGDFLQGSGLPPDENSIFQLGSISKVFTGVALARAIEENKISLETKANDYLPESLVDLKPLLNGITVQQLATHTSGLPDTDGLDRFLLRFLLTPHNFYENLTENSLVQGITNMKSSHTSNLDTKAFQYSTLGMGLLGHILCDVNDMEYQRGACYQDILDREVFTPLGMIETSISLSNRDATKVVGAYGPSGLPVPHWSMATLHGAKGLNGSAHDLAQFLSEYIMGRADLLGRAMVLATQTNHSQSDLEFEMGLGWKIASFVNADNRKQPLYFHSGATHGNSGFIGFDPVNKIGLVLLFNTATSGLEQFGLNILKRKVIVP